MILYHGSFVAVEKPDLIHSRENVDFGKTEFANCLSYRKSSFLPSV